MRGLGGGVFLLTVPVLYRVLKEAAQSGARPISLIINIRCNYGDERV
jgi:hypothetical protein